VRCEPKPDGRIQVNIGPKGDDPAEEIEDASEDERDE